MRQQINLYEPIFSEARKPFSAGMALACIVLLLGVLAAVSIKANLRVQALAIEVEALRAQQLELESSAGSDGEVLESAEAIKARIERLEHSVNERTRAFDMLRSGAAGRTIGFAPRLEALARRHVDGIWIDAMHLSGTNTAMMLSGSTLDPDIVPRYLRSLAQDEVLTGARFDDFIILRPSEESAEGEEQQAKRKTYDPKLLRFKAGSSALERSLAPEASS